MKTLLCLLILFPSLSHARTIFEPNVSLGTGSLGVEGDIIGTPVDTSVQFQTLSAGFRYGIVREYIHVTAVLDGILMMPEEGDPEFTDFIGIGIGYEWNIPLRTYVNIGNFNQIGSGDSSLGVGVELSYFWSESFLIGLKYMDMSFGDFTVPITGGGTAANVQFGGQIVSLTVSVPFEFDYPGTWWREKEYK